MQRPRFRRPADADRPAFEEQPEVLLALPGSYLHLLVDEFQDTNLVQYELIKLLGAKYRNICVVGDPDQSIYSWWSADLRNILGFEKDYPDAKFVLLEQNYRSTKIFWRRPPVLSRSTSSVKPRDLWTENEVGEQAIRSSKPTTSRKKPSSSSAK